jgi:hypothetical protein
LIQRVLIAIVAAAAIAAATTGAVNLHEDSNKISHDSCAGNASVWSVAMQNHPVYVYANTHFNSSTRAVLDQAEEAVVEKQGASTIQLYLLEACNEGWIQAADYDDTSLGK